MSIPRTCIPSALAALLIASNVVACIPRSLQDPTGREAGERHGTSIISTDVPEGAALLHSISRPATRSERELAVLTDAMVSALVQHRGDGLAAIQVGAPTRVVILRRESEKHESRFQVLIDPTLLARDPETIGSWERCLSVPWGYRYTDRSSAITIRFRDLAGSWQQETLAGADAVVMQHELDHLDGKLLSDGLERSDFIPEDRIAEVAAAARQDCRNAGRSDCGRSLLDAWTRWRSGQADGPPRR